MTLQLMKNYLAVKIDDALSKTSIIIPDIVEKSKPTQGIITHIGGEDMNFKVGQVILFEKYGTIEIELNKEPLYIIDKRDVLGIVN